MTVRLWRRVVTLAVAGVSAMALLGVTAAAAAAYTVTRLNGHVLSVGRGGVVQLQPHGSASVGAILGSIAVSALVIAVVTVVVLRMDRRSEPAKLAAVPDQPAGEVPPASSRDRERRAA